MCPFGRDTQVGTCFIFRPSKTKNIRLIIRAGGILPKVKVPLKCINEQGGSEIIQGCKWLLLLKPLRLCHEPGAYRPEGWDRIGIQPMSLLLFFFAFFVFFKRNHKEVAQFSAFFQHRVVVEQLQIALVSFPSAGCYREGVKGTLCSSREQVDNLRLTRTGIAQETAPPP